MAALGQILTSRNYMWNILTCGVVCRMNKILVQLITLCLDMKDSHKRNTKVKRWYLTVDTLKDVCAICWNMTWKSTWTSQRKTRSHDYLGIYHWFRETYINWQTMINIVKNASHIVISSKLGIPSIGKSSQRTELPDAKVFLILSYLQI